MKSLALAHTGIAVWFCDYDQHRRGNRHNPEAIALRLIFCTTLTWLSTGAKANGRDRVDQSVSRIAHFEGAGAVEAFAQGPFYAVLLDRRESAYASAAAARIGKSTMIRVPFPGAPFDQARSARDSRSFDHPAQAMRDFRSLLSVESDPPVLNFQVYKLAAAANFDVDTLAVAMLADIGSTLLA